MKNRVTESLIITIISETASLLRSATESTSIIFILDASFVLKTG